MFRHSFIFISISSILSLTSAAATPTQVIKRDDGLTCGATGHFGWYTHTWMDFERYSSTAETIQNDCLLECLSHSECLSFQYNLGYDSDAPLCALSVHPVSDTDFSPDANGDGILFTVYDVRCEIPTVTSRPEQATPTCGACITNECWDQKNRMVKKSSKRGTSEYTKYVKYAAGKTPGECVLGCQARSAGLLGCDGVMFSLDKNGKPTCLLLLGTSDTCFYAGVNDGGFDDNGVWQGVDLSGGYAGSTGFYDLKCPIEDLAYTCYTPSGISTSTIVSSTSSSLPVTTTTTSSISTTSSVVGSVSSTISSIGGSSTAAAPSTISSTSQSASATDLSTSSTFSSSSSSFSDLSTSSTTFISSQTTALNPATSTTALGQPSSIDSSSTLASTSDVSKDISASSTLPSASIVTSDLPSTTQNPSTVSNSHSNSTYSNSTASSSSASGTYPMIITQEISSSSEIVYTSSEIAYTTSTIYTSLTYTITSCAPSISNCPERLGSPTTETVALYTTVCPVGASSTSQSSSEAVASSYPGEEIKPSGNVVAASEGKYTMLAYPEHSEVASVSTVIVYPIPSATDQSAPSLSTVVVYPFPSSEPTSENNEESIPSPAPETYIPSSSPPTDGYQPTTPSTSPAEDSSLVPSSPVEIASSYPSAPVQTPSLPGVANVTATYPTAAPTAPLLSSEGVRMGRWSGVGYGIAIAAGVILVCI